MNPPFFKVAGVFLFMGFFATYVWKNLDIEAFHKSPDPVSSIISPAADIAVISRDRVARATANLVTGKFSLIDHHGNRRTNLDFRGHTTLVYFGYTFCPDVCPQALSNISEALYALREKAADFNVLFISIDPERDGVEELAAYLESFHPRITALTGTESEIREATRSFRAHYARVNDDSSTDYLMDHSSIAYVLDKRGRFVTSFNHEASVDSIIELLLKNL